MIIDFHCHIGKDIEGEEYSLGDLKKSMDKWNIDKACIFPFNNSNKIMIQESLDILEKSKQEPWIIPFLRFNPNEISKEELKNLITKGFRGIKLHPSAQEFEIDNNKFSWIYELCQEKNLPILFHCATKNKNSNPLRVLNIAKEFPNLKIVIAHFFGDDLSLMEKLKDYKNIYSDISIYARTLRINHATYKHNFKNLLFASDAPYDSQKVVLVKINESNLNEEDKKLILYKNAEKILNLK
ncbi:amidohydrolase family protein [archaeon]|jgi:uncharacterized protein|nr:amidohydrolase family protein [archaeon]